MKAYELCVRQYLCLRGRGGKAGRGEDQVVSFKTQGGRLSAALREPGFERYLFFYRHVMRCSMEIWIKFAKRKQRLPDVPNA